MSLSPNTAWVRARLCKLQKGCTRLTATSDKVYQLLAHGRWFSPDTPASSTTKTVCHDIAESGVKHQKSIKSFCTFSFGHCVVCSAIYGFWLSLLYLQTLLVPRESCLETRATTILKICADLQYYTNSKRVGKPELVITRQ